MQSFQAISVGHCSIDASTIDHVHPYPRTGSRVFESICRTALRRLCAGPTMEQRAPSNACLVMLETILIFDAWIDVCPTMSGNPRVATEK